MKRSTVSVSLPNSPLTEGGAAVVDAFATMADDSVFAETGNSCSKSSSSIKSSDSNGSLVNLQ
jgi:hypothetical protein